MFNTAGQQLVLTEVKYASVVALFELRRSFMGSAGSVAHKVGRCLCML